ncbi:MAG: SDR family oxidoreductase [Alkalispirochaeta sp.]
MSTGHPPPSGRSRGLSQRYVNRLAGLRVAVTGSSRGIGRETVRLLLSGGATVVLNGRSHQRLTETEGRLREEFPGAALSACTADISTAAGAETLASHITRHAGGLDILINNAGTSMRGPVGELAASTISTMIAGNLESALQVTRACLPLLQKSEGHIAFVSTVGAIHGFPGISVYSAAKAALERFSESFNAEYRHRGVTAGVVYLGFVENDPDKEIMSADGRPFHHQRKAMQSQTAAAAAVVRASLRRQQRTITVGLGVLLDVARRISPSLVTRVLARSGGSIHSVGTKEEGENEEDKKG